jgi:hypothetical protein
MDGESAVGAANGGGGGAQSVDVFAYGSRGDDGSGNNAAAGARASALGDHGESPPMLMEPWRFTRSAAICNWPLGFCDSQQCYLARSGNCEAIRRQVVPQYKQY